jgi:purine-nucleoside phosphorylase
VAAEKGVRALCIMTVSDHVITWESTSSEERQTTFDEMVHLALEALVLDAG